MARDLRTRERPDLRTDFGNGGRDRWVEEPETEAGTEAEGHGRLGGHEMWSEGTGHNAHRRRSGGGLSRREAVFALAAAAWPWLLGPVRAAGAARAAVGGLGGAGVPRRGSGPGAAAELPPRTVGLRSLGGDFRFDPPGLLVSRGETVTWLNMGDFHTVTAFHPANAGLLSAPVPLRIPEGAEPFHSGILGLDAGSVFESAFEVEGVYDYFCQPHYSFGMVGRIVVAGPRGGPALTADDSALPEAARRELPAVRDITGPAGRAHEWASRINGVLLLRTRNADPGPGAQAVLEAVRSDDPLLQALRKEGAEEEFFGRLGAFVDAVVGGVGYERLLERADAAKEALGLFP